MPLSSVSLSRLCAWLIVACAAPFAALHASDEDPYAAAVRGSMPEDYFPELREMIADALKQSPQMIASEMEIAVSDAQKLYNGIAPMLPQVGGYLQYGTNISAVANNASASTRNSGFFFDVSGKQAIFQWGQLRDRLKQSQVQVAMTERNYATGYQQFAASLRRQYLALIADKISLRNLGFARDVHDRALQAAQERYKAGAIAPGSLQGAQLDDEEARLAFDQAQQEYDFTRRQFARQLGRTDFPDADVPASIPPPNFSNAAAAELLADVLRTGARYTPDAQNLLLQIRQQALDYKYWKVNLLPRLALQGDVNQTNQQNASSGSVQQTAILNESYYLHADWNIFDGLATRGHKEEALVRRRQAERQLRIKAEATMDQAQNAERAVEFAWRSLQITLVRDQISQTLLRRAEEDLKRGAGSDESVAAARSGAYTSEYFVASARTAFLSAWSDFVALTGHDPAMNNLPARYVRPVQ